MPFPPAELDGTLALGVAPVFPQFFQVAATLAQLPLVKAGSTASLKVQLTRSNGFEDEVSRLAERSARRA